MERDESFHLYLLIGQSNMAGRGALGPQDTEVHPRVFALDKTNTWVSAVDPLHFDKSIAGVGPGLAFGKAMADHDPSIHVGLIPCAAGGSPITVWQHGRFWEQTNSKPYDDAIERTRIATDRGVLKGILWHQGESDSNENDAELYEERLVTFVHTLRAELGVGVPFVCATLADFYVTRNPWAARINQAIAQIPHRIAHTAYVESRNLDHKGDEVHFDAASARELGSRYAQAIIRLQDEGEAS